MKVRNFRDLTLINHDPQKFMVIACDSCGSVGSKEEDIVKVPPEVVGYYTTRVAVMEVLSVGAQILTVINTLSVEMEPTGRQIITGIQRLLKEGGIEAVCLNGSTEENFKTLQTAMGVTVIGEVEKPKAKINTSKKGDLVVVIGVPKVGEEITIPFDNEICSVKDLQTLLTMKEAREIYTVGSKGIMYEANFLAHENHCRFQAAEDVKIDLKKSAGPATVILFTIEPENLPYIEEKIQKPCRVIGKLI
ncbi:AIR synthase related protein [Natronincola ferrireducens]|uniref:Alpha-ribazole kinase n=1 Tax=Natronincola ferrireducens TaxID=393762 RepID=A0A1G8WT67_9FIRM|nr:AIR synthase related protein [Natronincola ferrireducens]SDJ80790.1 alpha-ribazole kinase [Natronincola ferrireducens]